jgi:hypothetical protein
MFVHTKAHARGVRLCITKKLLLALSTARRGFKVIPVIVLKIFRADAILGPQDSLTQVQL